jgi:hypothetical protein
MSMSIPGWRAVLQHAPHRGLTIMQSSSLALVSVVAMCASAIFAIHLLQVDLLASQQKLIDAKSSLARRKAENATVGSLTILRAKHSVEDVTRDVVRFAQSNNIQIKTIRVQPQSKADSLSGQVQYDINAVGNYGGIKAWIAELLARYASMAASSLAIHAPIGDAKALEAGVTLKLLSIEATDLKRPPIEALRRDSFALIAPPPPPVKAPTIVAPVVSAPPVAPALNMSFAGRMTDPGGATKVFVLLDKAAIAIEPGQMLPNGYLVDAVTDQSIELSYPPLKVKARFDLPNAPKQEIR